MERGIHHTLSEQECHSFHQKIDSLTYTEMISIHASFSFTYTCVFDGRAQTTTKTTTIHTKLWKNIPLKRKKKRTNFILWWNIEYRGYSQLTKGIGSSFMNMEFCCQNLLQCRDSESSWRVLANHLRCNSESTYRRISIGCNECLRWAQWLMGMALLSNIIIKFFWNICQ